MRKILRIALILLLVVVAVFMVLAVIEPKDITVTRSTLIKAPKNAVFEQIVYFKNWPHWSPWYEIDTNTKLTYSGIDGQVGSAYHWIGTPEKKTGEGDMKNTGVSGTTFNFEVDFSKPMKNVATGTLQAEDTSGMTKTTWTFHIHFKFPWNAFGAFMNMEDMLGKDFDRGLGNMKKYVETHTTASAGITEVQYSGKLYAGVRKVIGWADMDKFFAESYKTIGMEAKDKINGPSASLCFNWDTSKMQADMAAVFPISDSGSKLKGISYFPVAPSKAVMYVLKGSYVGEMNAHSSIVKYLHDKGLTQTLVVEDYPANPYNEKDTAKWVTNIYYLVK